VRLKCLWVSAITKNAKHYAKSLEKPSILITTFSNCSSFKWSKPNKSQTLTPNLNNASSLVHKIKIKCLNQIYWMRYKHELFFFFPFFSSLFFLESTDYLQMFCGNQSIHIWIFFFYISERKLIQTEIEYIHCDAITHLQHPIFLFTPLDTQVRV